MTATTTSSDPYEAPDPAFDQLSAAETFGYVFKMCGEGALRTLLAMDGSTPTTKEWLLDAVAELNQAGLGRVAGIVLEVASQTPSMADMALCDYPDAPGQEANRRAWRSAQERPAGPLGAEAPQG